MKLSIFFCKASFVFFFLCSAVEARAQFLMDMVDTTTELGKGMFYMYKKFGRIQMGGYIQPQFQAASQKGINSYSGGDFAPQVNNRFMLRRGRLRFDYIHYTESKLPSVQFVFQFDGTERGVVIRDFWGRIFENRWSLISVTSGMFARPFGYELNLSSSDRESPERGRMSQILMRTERDLGAMISFEPRRKNHPWRYLKIDVGLFNGQGLNALGEFDSYKDKIGRIFLKPYPFGNGLHLSAGISYLNGGLLQSSRYINRLGSGNNKNNFVTDSALENIGKKAPRIYYGLDAQLRLKSSWGNTELRGEYWWGTQPATANNPQTPASLLPDPLYIRNFDGAFFYLLQHIGNTRHQVGIKYDWYDPNTSLQGNLIGFPASNTNYGDIRFSTFSFGYNHYFHENLKLLLWYDLVKNEETNLPGYDKDVEDNVFTCRLQFRF